MKTQVSRLEEELGTDAEKLSEYNKAKQSLQTLQNTKTQGTIIRSRAGWWENGESGTRYFFYLV